MRDLKYRAMIGVGGIGSGRFFAVRGDATLTREESRGGRFLDRRDYCKLHIISHYVATLLGPGFASIPVGKVGDDDVGMRLLDEMKAAGLKLHHVHVSPGDQTLFSFCVVYPDGSGGNLTTDDSASSRVDAAHVRSSREDFVRYRGKGIALAVPEAPLEARSTLLKLGSDHGFLRVASFTSTEIDGVMDSGLVRDLDVLALNRDEAAAVCGPETESSAKIAEQAARRLAGLNPELRISITAGREGSWVWDGHSMHHSPAIPVSVQNTAGAGDAHLSGIIAGLAAGLELEEAHQLGALLAALSVTSPHTICPGTDRAALRRLALQSGMVFPRRVMSFLDEEVKNSETPMLDESQEASRQ